MLTRRRLILATALAPFARLATAHAGLRCIPTPFGPRCRAEVDFPTIAAKYDQQSQSQWCWAACISMLFEFYGHPVAQERIVRETYGATVNLPAGAGIVIARQLDRKWTDDRGRPFRSSLRAAYDYDAGVLAISDQQIVEALRSENPLIVGARSHAMLMSMVEFVPGPLGPRVVGAGAFDPWPGRGARAFEPDELLPVHRGGSLRFLAQARVRSL